MSSSRQYSRYSGAGILASDWSADPILPSHWSTAASPSFTKTSARPKLSKLKVCGIFPLIFFSDQFTQVFIKDLGLRLELFANSLHCNCMIACDFLSFYFLNLNFSFGLKFWFFFPKCLLYLVTNDNNKCLFVV